MDLLLKRRRIIASQRGEDTTDYTLLPLTFKCLTGGDLSIKNANKDLITESSHPICSFINRKRNTCSFRASVSLKNSGYLDTGILSSMQHIECFICLPPFFLEHGKNR